MTALHHSLPAPVTTAAPTAIGAHPRASTSISSPPSTLIVRAAPLSMIPDEFEGLTIASTVSCVMSPSATWMTMRSIFAFALETSRFQLISAARDGVAGCRGRLGHATGTGKLRQLPGGSVLPRSTLPRRDSFWYDH